jgi:hypothetical protein
MHDQETKQETLELVRQIQEKSLQLSDLEVILEDYARERSELLREIGRLKASLWEMIGDTPIQSSPSASETGADDKSKE